jgi:hypothetical protein
MFSYYYSYFQVETIGPVIKGIITSVSISLKKTTTIIKVEVCYLDTSHQI